MFLKFKFREFAAKTKISSNLLGNVYTGQFEDTGKKSDMF